MGCLYAINFLYICLISKTNLKQNIMALNVNSGGLISEAKAKQLISDFEIRFPGEVVSSFIGSTHLNAALAQQKCVGLRIYNGYDSSAQKISLVIVGVDEHDNDLLEEGLIYDQMVTCPPICTIGTALSKK